jgi:hypothetical protein
MKMRLIFLATCLTSFINFTGCEIQNQNTEVANSFIFNKGDTLIYRCDALIDTFQVDNVRDHYIDVDKKQDRVVDISVPEIDVNCKIFCRGMQLQLRHSACSLDFRNLGVLIRSDDNSYTIITYDIGNLPIRDVYVFQSTNSSDQRAVKTTYFNFKYGIIAYELFNGEVYELDEKYF